MTFALKVRTFFRELFGSRLVDTLELRIMEIQQESERRINDKDRVIDMLQADLANLRVKMETYEQIIIPVVSPVGNLFKAKPEPRTLERLSGPEPGTWAYTQMKWNEQMAAEAEAEKERDGIPGQAGQEVRQQVQS